MSYSSSISFHTKDLANSLFGLSPALASPSLTLIKCLRSGNTASWESLFRKMERRSLSLAWRILNNSHSAADAVQEGFFRAYRARETLRDDSVPERWLLAAVANAARDLLRERERNEGHRKRLLKLSASTHHDPEKPLEVEGALQQGLQTLDEMSRMIFLMVHQEGFTYQEVARMCDCPIGTVRSKLHRARTTLRGILGSREDVS